MADDIAVKVEHIHKTFKLPHEKQSSIKGALVNFRKHKKGYEKQQVLTDINFEIKKGEFFGIVGRNGSGKSTLLKLLAGIYTPDSGAITINGKLTPFIELGVGFNPELTGRENVFLNGALLGFNRKEMLAMYDDIVEFAELGRFMDQKLKNYSSGMQVRLAFSVAIRAKTDILLIDEVLAVGDQSFQDKCFKYFSQVKNSGTTVILVTHDMGSIERFCDRAYVVDKEENVNGEYEIPEAVSIYNRLNAQQSGDNAPSMEFPDHPFIKRVSLCGADGKPKDAYLSGEELKIRIELDRPEGAPKDITVGMAFHDSDNVNIAGPNSRSIRIPSTAKYVSYTIKELPFNMGKYWLTVAVLDGHGAQRLDLIDQGMSFFVNTKNVHYGKIILNDGWGYDS